jgi:APA family basic amino acid/polyamine antiporter
MHLIERITSRDLTDHLLESELREIIRERDDLTLDRFDRVVASCPIVDLAPETGLDELFEAVGEAMAPAVDVDAAEVVRLLQRREEEGSTVIGPGLAVPHLIVPGEGLFALVLVRARHGVVFPPDGERVQAVFVLAGSKDERNFHLRALSAICQVAQDPDFASKWDAARDVESMRDVVLLGERRRSDD